MIAPDDVHIGRTPDGAVFVRVEGVSGMTVWGESAREALDELRIAWAAEERDDEELERAVHPSEEWVRSHVAEWARSRSI